MYAEDEDHKAAAGVQSGETGGSDAAPAGPVSAIASHLATLADETATSAAKDAAVGALWELTERSSHHKKTILASQLGLAPLVETLAGGSPAAKETVASLLWACATNDAAEAAIVEAGALPPLVTLLRSGSPTAQGKAAGAIRNLAGLEANEWLIIKSGALHALVPLLGAGRAPKAREHAAGALANLTFTQRHHEAISQAGAVEPLVDLLNDQSATPEARQSASDALTLLAASPQVGHLLLQLGCPMPHPPRARSTAEGGAGEQTVTTEEEPAWEPEEDV